MRPSRQPAITVLAVLAVLFTSITPVAAAAPKGPRPIGTDVLARDSWIVTLAPDAKRGEPRRIAQAAGGQVGGIFQHAFNGFQFRGSAQAAAALERNPWVISVEPDNAIFLTETLPYGVQRIAAYGLGGVTGAYQAGFRGSGARIAVLDTGIDLDHPDLAASIDHGLGMNCLDEALQPNDGYGHGTHVAGTAAAPINGVGVAGVAPQARLVAVKMFDDAGNSSEAYALCALEHIIGLNLDEDPSNDIDVANMSWGEQRAGGTCETDALHGAICQAHAAGIILVAGAGNSAVNGSGFVPAAYPEVISVSAIADFDGKRGGLAGCGFVAELLANECDDTFAFFSNWGDVDVAAPGVRVHSTWIGGGYRTSSGTSMSAPHVAGVAALMAAAAPGLSPNAARDAILSSGECPNGAAADADGAAGCVGQGAWPDDRDTTPEPMVHALRAARAVAVTPPSEPEPPAAPSLSASATPTSIDLTWSSPANGGAQITAYNIYRGGTSGPGKALHATVEPGLGWSDTAVTTGEEWFYEVAAVNSIGEGARSNEASAVVPEPPPPPDPPSAPTLSATAGNGVVNLSWSAPADDGGAQVTAYEVYRRTSSTPYARIATLGNVLAYKDTGRTNGTTYWYQVAAANSAGVGAVSNEASAKPTAPATRPSAPRSLKASNVPTGIHLTWQPPTSSGGSTLTGYRVYRTGGSGGTRIFAVAPSLLTFTDTTVAPRTWYAYVVSAKNAVGESPASNIALIKTN